MNHAAPATNRSPIHGLTQIVLFNWPQYVVGSAVILLAAGFAAAVPLPPAVWWIIVAGVAAAAWWLVASLVASYWIYDLSPLTRWDWLVRCLPSDSLPSNVVNIHCGFDDTTLLVREVLPQTEVIAIDLYDPQRMTEPSIHRARRNSPPLAGTLTGTPEALLVDDGKADAVLFLLAAHELRKPAEREALFANAKRAIRSGGRVILAEHARNVWNFLAFGPGFMHFLPYGEWLRLGQVAGLKVVGEGCVTPFVRYLVLEK